MIKVLTTKDELERLGVLVALCKDINEVLAQIADQKEYKRVRDYIDDRFDIQFEYESPFIKKVDKK